MADNALVTPIVFSLPSAVDKRTQDRFQLEQQGVPCTVVKIVGEFVTVKTEVNSKFTIPQITIPQAYSAYAREPTQVGDKGYVVPSGYYIGGQSGQGGGEANFYNRANLTNAVFRPVSQKQFPTNPTRDLNAYFINGPNGVVLQDTQGRCKFTLTPTGITITIGGCTVTINASGLTVMGGDIVNNSLTVGSTHVHGGILPGPDNTGPPNP